MARARTLKPGFFSNESLADCQPLARLLFGGLWLHADREGRLEDRPKRLKAEILPYDDCDANALLDELERAGFIVRYEAQNVRCIQVLSFAKHQNPHPREPASSLPAVESRVKPRQEIAKQEPATETPEPARPFPLSPLPSPDSSSDADASDAARASDDGPLDLRKCIFDEQLPWLIKAGKRSERSTRAWLAKLCGEYGDAATLSCCLRIRAGPLPVDVFSAMRGDLERQKRNGQSGKANGAAGLSVSERRAAILRGLDLDMEPGVSGPGDDCVPASCGH